MSRQKTYLHEFDQLWRSIEFAINNCDGFLKFAVGSVQRNTKFFMAGDIVFIDWFHGQADRFPVYGVSRKGRNIANHFMMCQRFAAWDYTDDVIEKWNIPENSYDGVVRCIPTQGFQSLYCAVKSALQSPDSGGSLQAILASLRAGSPVSPVGACNRTLTQ